MTLEDSIQGFRLRVLRAATRSGNVSATCERYEVSRTLFYRWRQRFEQYGADGLVPKRRGPGRGRPPQVSVQDERRVLAVALAWPTCGPQFVSDWLARDGVAVAPVTIWRLLRRHGLNTRRARLAVLEVDSAQTQGILTERTARARRKTRHVAADQPGALLSLDTFYVGRLKGVGKVWQITGCDAASSYTWAHLVVGEVTATQVWRFVDRHIRPSYQAAGWRLQRILTDGGHEFKGAFVAGCTSRQIRITRTKPRHAWTNGFVERVQGTLLHEHWRLAFRRQFPGFFQRLQESTTSHPNQVWATFAISRYRHSAFANLICLGVRNSGSNRRGLAANIGRRSFRTARPRKTNRRPVPRS